VLDATGGWQLLLDALCDDYRKAQPLTEKEACERAAAFAADLQEGRPLRERFFQALGLVDRRLQYVLGRCVREKGAPREEEYFRLLFSEDADRAALGDTPAETAWRCLEFLERFALVRAAYAGSPSSGGATWVVNPLVARLWPDAR
jgi:hypothetical protein